MIVTTLGIDVGTTNLKVALVSHVPDSRSATRTAGVDRCLILPTPSSLPDLLATVRRAIAEVIDGGPAPVAVGIASQAETGALVDGRGTPVTPLLRWGDPSARSVAQHLVHPDDARALHERTGIAPGHKMLAARLAHLALAHPAEHARAAGWDGLAEAVARDLTGRRVTDRTLGARTGLVELGTDRWSAELVAQLEVPDHLLPALVPDGHAGASRPGIDGLRPGTPVIVAGHDHAVAAHAVGARDDGAVDSVGTSEAVLVVSAERPDVALAAREGLSVARTAAGTAWTVLAGAATGGAHLDLWRERLGDVEPDDGQDPTLLPLVLPYPRGRQSPLPDPDARLVVLGRADDLPAARLMAAAHEGSALHAAWMLDVATRAARADPGAIVLLGGAAPGLARRRAAVLPRPVRVPAHPEATVVGAAVLAGERTGAVERSTLPTRLVAATTDPARAARVHDLITAATAAVRPMDGELS